MKRFTVVLALVFAVALTLPAMAATGNGAPAGPHYNLNIIGVENPKNPDMTDSNRHTIFVALGKNGGVTTDIWLRPAAEFRVCDGNGFDEATDCDGNVVARGDGAVFELPCNTNIPNDQTGGLLPCEAEDFPLAYEVWVRALGTPGGGATITTCAYDDGVKVCSSENVVLFRGVGKDPNAQQKFVNKTNELTSLVADIDGDTLPERVALFRDELQDWFWQYQNRGLRLAQLRFYKLDDIKN